MKYVPECLRNLPPQKSKPADAKRRKAARELAELTIIECIQRLKAERRSKPKDWERGYNSSITVLELFAAEVNATHFPLPLIAASPESSLPELVVPDFAETMVEVPSASFIR